MTPLVRRRLLVQIGVSYGIAVLSAIAWVAILTLFFGATGEAGGLVALALWGLLAVGALALLCGVVSHAWYLKDGSSTLPGFDRAAPFDEDAPEAIRPPGLAPRRSDG